jgi:hypothetical protein
MKTCKVIFAIFLLSPVLFLGCGSSNTGVEDAASASLRRADSQGGVSGGVVRQTPTPQASATPAHEQTLPSGNAVIATRLGSGGIEVDLMRAGIAGDLFAVELRCRNINKHWQETRYVKFPVEQVSVVDDATSRRYSVLKDQTGQYMAAPMIDHNGNPIKSIYMYIAAEGDGVIWFKFPAPPPEAKTVSINVPTIAPFDNIPIQR